MHSTKPIVIIHNNEIISIVKYAVSADVFIMTLSMTGEMICDKFGNARGIHIDKDTNYIVGIQKSFTLLGVKNEDTIRIKGILPSTIHDIKYPFLIQDFNVNSTNSIIGDRVIILEFKVNKDLYHNCLVCEDMEECQIFLNMGNPYDIRHIPKHIEIADKYLINNIDNQLAGYIQHEYINRVFDVWKRVLLEDSKINEYCNDIRLPQKYRNVTNAIYANLFEIRGCNKRVIKNLFDYLFYHIYNKVLCDKPDDSGYYNNYGDIYRKDYPLTLNALRRLICITPQLSSLVMHKPVRYYDLLWVKMHVDTILLYTRNDKYKQSSDEYSSQLYWDTYTATISCYEYENRYVNMYISLNWTILYACDFAYQTNVDKNSHHIIKLDDTNDLGLRYRNLMPKYLPNSVKYFTNTDDITIACGLNQLCFANKYYTMINDSITDHNPQRSVDTTVYHRSVFAAFNSKRDNNIEYSLLDFRKILDKHTFGILNESFNWSLFMVGGSAIYDIITKRYKSSNLPCIEILYRERRNKRVTTPEMLLKRLVYVCEKHIISRIKKIDILDNVNIDTGYNYNTIGSIYDDGDMMPFVKINMSFKVIHNGVCVNMAIHSMNFVVKYGNESTISANIMDVNAAYYNGHQLCLFPRFFIAINGYLSDVIPYKQEKRVTEKRMSYMSRYKLITLRTRYSDEHHQNRCSSSENNYCICCGKLISWDVIRVVGTYYKRMSSINDHYTCTLYDINGTYDTSSTVNGDNNGDNNGNDSDTDSDNNSDVQMNPFIIYEDPTTECCYPVSKMNGKLLKFDYRKIHATKDCLEHIKAMEVNITEVTIKGTASYRKHDRYINTFNSPSIISLMSQCMQFETNVRFIRNKAEYYSYYNMYKDLIEGKSCYHMNSRSLDERTNMRSKQLSTDTPSCNSIYIHSNVDTMCNDSQYKYDQLQNIYDNICYFTYDHPLLVPANQDFNIQYGCNYKLLSDVEDLFATNVPVL